MLKGDITEFAGWEQSMTAKFPETDVLHWHRQEPEWRCSKPGEVNTDGRLSHFGDKARHIQCNGYGAERSSLFCALAYFFEQFAHDALLKEYPKPKEPTNTPDRLTALSKVPKSELHPSTYLRWLATLIGDLHQPLHWLGDHRYGKDLTVVYNGRQQSLLS